MTGLRLPRVPGATQQQQSAARGVVGIAGLGWASILIAGAGFALPSFCSGSTVWQLPGADAFSFAFLFRSPGQLALAWGLMLAAMMCLCLWHQCLMCAAGSCRDIAGWP